MSIFADSFTKILDSAGIGSALLLIAIALWVLIFKRLEVNTGRKGLRK